MFSSRKTTMPTADRALPGRDEPIAVSGTHFVNGTSILPPFPEEAEIAYFGMGCFWGAEREFWTIPGVYTTAVGYQGGMTNNPTYEEVCSGMTGHTEAVLVAYDPGKVEYEKLLAAFWEAHDPTQGMRQGNDRGTQYRSAVYTTTPEQLAEAKASRDDYAQRLSAAGYGAITTEITEPGPFFYAEEYHQQYLAKNPNGYCGLEGTGVACAVGLEAVPEQRPN
jgi:peptide-methionine (S)-S-oxide reductase